MKRFSELLFIGKRKEAVLQSEEEISKEFEIKERIVLYSDYSKDVWDAIKSSIKYDNSLELDLSHFGDVLNFIKSNYREKELDKVLLNVTGLPKETFFYLLIYYVGILNRNSRAKTPVFVMRQANEKLLIFSPSLYHKLINRLKNGTRSHVARIKIILRALTDKKIVKDGAIEVGELRKLLERKKMASYRKHSSTFYEILRNLESYGLIKRIREGKHMYVKAREVAYLVNALIDTLV